VFHPRALGDRAHGDGLAHALVNVHAEDPTAGSQTETLRAFPHLCAGGRERRWSAGDLRARMRGDEELGLFKEVEHRLALQRTLRDGSAGAMTVRARRPCLPGNQMRPGASPVTTGSANPTSRTDRIDRRRKRLRNAPRFGPGA